MKTLLAAGKKAITRMWLKPQSPSNEDWIDIVHQIYIMEKLTYSLRAQHDKFINIWSWWTDFIRLQRQDFTRDIYVMWLEYNLSSQLMLYCCFCIFYLFYFNVFYSSYCFIFF